MFRYKCPKCGSRYELRMRVTLTRRRCAYCGMEITPKEIDYQRLGERIIRFLLIVLVIVFFSLCSGVFTRPP